MGRFKIPRPVYLQATFSKFHNTPVYVLIPLQIIQCVFIYLGDRISGLPNGSLFRRMLTDG